MLTRNEWIHLLIQLENDKILQDLTIESKLSSIMNYPKPIIEETLTLLTKYGYIWEVHDYKQTSYQLTTKGKHLIEQIKKKYQVQISYTM